MKNLKYKILAFSVIFIYCRCSENDVNQTSNANNESEFISAVDISSYPKIELSNPVFKDNNGVTISFLEFLKSKEINTIRIRLWVNPIDEHSSLSEVKSFSETLKSMGFKSSNEAVLQDNITLNSFNRNPAPLYILDGVITCTLDSMTPSSIAELYILKGEKATDKYGQKGKHGVVEVITKKATTKP